MIRVRQLLVVLALVASATTVVTTSVAATGRSGACTTADGAAVTVVIDFQGLGGETKVFCASGLADGASGRDALAAVGVAVAGTTHDGASFVCRLDGRPGPKEIIKKPADPAYVEDCVDTPPGDAYWSYWQAAPGGDWAYSATGLNSRVKLGGFEGWSFALGQAYGSGSRPRVEPVTPPEQSTPAVTTPPPKAKTPKPKTSKSKRSKSPATPPESNPSKPKSAKAERKKSAMPGPETKSSASTAKVTASSGAAASSSVNSVGQSVSTGTTGASNSPLDHGFTQTQLNPNDQSLTTSSTPLMNTHGDPTKLTQPATSSDYAVAEAPGNSPVAPAIAAIAIVVVAAIAGLFRVRRNRWGR